MTVSARGYNEGNYVGVEDYSTYSSMHFSYNNILQLDGIGFGNNPAKDFATWASQATCNLGGTASSGFTCVDSAIKSASCTITGLNSVPLASGRYSFPTRGIKVTCKAACGQSNSLGQGNWNGIIGQVTAFLRDNNYYAARFTGIRLTTNTVVARCRVTSPSNSQFGIDICPDQIPHSGANILAADSQA
ncbi:putative Dihydroorotase, homodimeric type [Seiridium unicorne]|uniref:Dihydroorotase, homodimeric type n=1 Tax=Seiridium unicorne TaxID=138068 RepID=A0ABR2UZA4_9PEZI